MGKNHKTGGQTGCLLGLGDIVLRRGQVERVKHLAHSFPAFRILDSLSQNCCFSLGITKNHELVAVGGVG